MRNKDRKKEIKLQKREKIRGPLPCPFYRFFLSKLIEQHSKD